MESDPEEDDKVYEILKSIEQDRSNGLNKLRKLAEKGNRCAILNLGLWLSADEETTELSLPWLHMANDFGFASAAWNLAMIARERGDVEEVRRWIDRAADLGDEDAMTVREDDYDVDAYLRTLRD